MGVKPHAQATPGNHRPHDQSSANGTAPVQMPSKIE